MRTFVRTDWLPLGALIGTACLIVAGYFTIETSWWYRGFVVGFIGLITLHTVSSYDLRYARLYLLFLLGVTASYALIYRYPVLAVAGITLALALAVCFSSRTVKKERFSWKVETATAIVFTQLVLLLSGLSLAVVAKAALIMLALAGAEEFGRYSGLERWRVGKSYGILILLLLLLILITVYVARP